MLYANETTITSQSTFMLPLLIRSEEMVLRARVYSCVHSHMHAATSNIHARTHTRKHALVHARTHAHTPTLRLHRLRSMKTLSPSGHGWLLQTDKCNHQLKVMLIIHTPHHITLTRTHTHSHRYHIRLMCTCSHIKHAMFTTESKEHFV